MRLFLLFLAVHVKTIGRFKYAQDSTLYLAVKDNNIQWPLKREKPMTENMDYHSAGISLINPRPGVIKTSILFWFVSLCIALEY